MVIAAPTNWSDETCNNFFAEQLFRNEPEEIELFTLNKSRQ
jgi:hypothetical protein